MLTVIDQRDKAIYQLDPEGQEAMLAAFARPAPTYEHRKRGAAVVREVQRHNRWLSCDCLGPGEDPPILVPVTETHIRRESSRPDHADGCPFEMDASERERHAKSLRAPQSGKGYKLARAFPTARPGPVRGERREGKGDEDAGEDPDEAGAAAHRGSRKAYHRDSLARLLFELLRDAKVNQVGPGPRGRETQVSALHVAARKIPLGPGLQLSDVLETDLSRLDALILRIQRRSNWPRGRRPHGVLAFVAARIEDDALVAASGARLAVDGPISVFGPGHGRMRHGPFVVAVLVAAPDERSPPAPLKAYAHPCWSHEDMLPVDSAHERRCLTILTNFRDWMARSNLDVEIEKPLFDRSRHYTGREDAGAVVKPDFEGKILTASGAFVRSFVVEVMGFNHPEYRRAKGRLRRFVEDKRMGYIEHVAHAGVPQEESDAGLRRALKKFGDHAAERAAKPRRPEAATPEPRTAPWDKASIPPRAPAVQDPEPARPPPSAPAWPALAPLPPSARPTAAPLGASPRLPPAPPPVPEQSWWLPRLWSRWFGTA